MKKIQNSNPSPSLTSSPARWAVKEKTMKIAVVTLAIAIHIASGHPLEAAGGKPSTSSCNVKVVSYRFVGTPGHAFEYAGRSTTIPAAGWIELLARKDVTLAGPTDAFGTVTVCLNGPACTVASVPEQKADPVDQTRTVTQLKPAEKDSGA